MWISKICLTSLFIFLIAVTSPASFAATELEQLKAQVKSLTQKVEDLQFSQEESMLDGDQNQSSVKSFLSDDLTLGGFFESAITGISGPDTSGQVAASSNLLGLNISARFSDQFRFVSQLLTGLNFSIANPENDPRGTLAQRQFSTPTFGAVPAQGFIEYSLSDAFRVQTGLGYVPFGIAFQQREVVLFVRRGGPQLLRTRGLASPLWQGVHINGAIPTRLSRMGYNVYTFTTTENPKALGGGTRVWWNSPQDTVNFGLSSQVGKRSSDTFRTVGADLRLKLGPVNMLTEYARSFRENDDPWAAYIEPSVAIYKDIILLYTYADYGTSPLTTTTAGTTSLSSPYKRIEYGAGFNWLPTPFTRFRLGAFVYNYLGDTASINDQDRDYRSLDLSAGIAF